MHKKTSVTAAKGKANTNVTIIKFKTPETSKRKQTSVDEKDPLAITDYDWEAAGSSNIPLKSVRFKSLGARKELPDIKKTPSVGKSFSRTTLLTPTGLKKIQAIPIGSVTENKSPKKKPTPQTSITVNLPVKRAARSTKPSFYVDSSGDSDEPISKVAKKCHKAVKSVKKSSVANKSNKKATKTKISNFIKTSKKPNKLQTSKNKPKNKSSKYLTKTQTKDKQKSKSNYKKMIQKRAQRISNFKPRVDYNYLAKKGEQNNRNEKKCITTKKKKNIQIKKQRKTLDDYLPLIRKYRQLIPENQPFVRIERLKFSAAHFSNERIRLISDIDLFRDGAAFYGLLGNIFSHLNLAEKLRCSIVCRLWNRALNEDAAWHNLPLKDVVLHDLRTLERIVLKRETKVISLNNVDIVGKAVDYELCRLSCVKELVVQEPSSLLLKKLIIACNELENVVVTDTNLHDLSNLNIYIKNLNAQNCIVSETENRLLKTWSDLESLSVHSFDPRFYYNMGLLLSLKHLKLKQLSITSNISQFIENIPNIEYIEFTPEYSNINYANGNKAIVESLKHCPSLKKLTWITVEEISIKKEKIEIKTIKNEIPVVEPKEDNNISLAKTENTQQSTLFEIPESLNKAETDSLNVRNETEKMEIDVCVPDEKADSDDQMETEEVSKTISQQQDSKSLDDDKNIEILDCLKTSDGNESFALADKEFENEVGCNDKKDKIKQDLDNIKENLSSMANENISVKNEDKEQSKSIEILTESLQLLALKTYLKSSLSECEVNFKIVKKFNYVD